MKQTKKPESERGNYKKMKETILLVGIVMILLLSNVFAKGGARHPCYDEYIFLKNLSNNSYSNLTKTEINIKYLLMVLYCDGGIYEPYNFGKVTYHKKSIAGTHWY